MRNYLLRLTPITIAIATTSPGSTWRSSKNTSWKLHAVHQQQLQSHNGCSHSLWPCPVLPNDALSPHISVTTLFPQQHILFTLFPRSVSRTCGICRATLTRFLSCCTKPTHQRLTTEKWDVHVARFSEPCKSRSESRSLSYCSGMMPRNFRLKFLSRIFGHSLGVHILYLCCYFRMLGPDAEYLLKT